MSKSASIFLFTTKTVIDRPSKIRQFRSRQTCQTTAPNRILRRRDKLLLSDWCGAAELSYSNYHSGGNPSSSSHNRLELIRPGAKMMKQQCKDKAAAVIPV